VLLEQRNLDLSKDVFSLILHLLNSRTTQFEISHNVIGKYKMLLGILLDQISRKAPVMQSLKFVGYSSYFRDPPPAFLKSITGRFLKVKTAKLDYWTFADVDVKTLVPLIPNVEELHVSDSFDMINVCLGNVQQYTSAAFKFKLVLLSSISLANSR
jgi:hypothetical protein